MKFLFIAPRFHTNQHFWVKMLVERGHKVEFFVWRIEKTENHSVVAPELIDSLFGKHRNMAKEDIRWEIPSPARFWKKMRAFNPDVVVVRDPFFYIFAFLAMILARFQKRKVVIYSQTLLHKPVSWARSFVVRVIMRLLADLWITPVKGDNKKFNKFHPKAFYVPLAVEPLINNKHTTSKMLKIISVGKLYLPKKRNLMLLEAIKDMKDVHVTFVGFLGSRDQTYLSEMREYIAKHGMEKRVEIYADMSHQETLGEYGKHDLFVLAGSEPLAYSVLEAIATGLAVICSTGNGARWYVEEGQNGYVFKEDNVQDLREKILILASDRKLLISMQIKSQELAKNKYAPDAVYKKFISAIGS
ncbi:MAG: glycosyltransferase family 4 protein [Candidatus Colwellbacteria bacterium]|nr:glycosyltransferase family 4 protein [Candidatus Colwellbacteria bacterium]